VALYFGAKWLVRGGASLAVRLGVTPLLVGLTMVACDLLLLDTTIYTLKSRLTY
jgi:hypothetical protein